MDAAVRHHDDTVEISPAAGVMADRYYCYASAPRDMQYGITYQILRLIIQTSRRLIQQQQLRTNRQRPRQPYPLLLPPTQLHALPSHPRLQPLRPARHHLPNPHLFTNLHHPLLVNATKINIRSEGPLEYNGLLRDVADALAGEAAADGSGGGGVQAEEEFEDGGFAAAAGADDADVLALVDVEGQVV